MQFAKEIYKIPEYRENVEKTLQIAFKILRIKLDNVTEEQALILGVKPGKCTMDDILHGIC